jgi:hypothetical protein
MPTLLDFRRRTRSVKNTQQITRAMKFIAAARLRRAQEKAVSLRPYAAGIREILRSGMSRIENPEQFPMLAHRPEEKILVLVTSGERGLAGAFNANVLRQAFDFLREKSDKSVEVITIAKKGRDAFRKRSWKVVGEYVDVTSQCAGRPIGAASMLTCNRMLSAVPSKIFSLNEGLNTLQFMSVSVNPHDPTGEVQGGTQDNGTWLFTGDSKVWTQTIYGDGGTSGFDVGNPAIRFNQFFGGFGDVNFKSGDPTAWVVVTAPMLNSGEAVGFYWPEIADPSVPGTMYTGFQHVWRTKDNAGNQSFLEANCPEFTTPGNQVGCGDWVALGGPRGPGNAGDLTSTLYGADRAGGVLGRVARAPSDTGTLWASTSLGRLFIAKNAAAEPSTAVAFTRLDTLAANDPNRFISGIYVDPSNPNRAWVSYSGYNTTVGSTAPGHIFEVRFNPAGPSATWVDRSYDLADLPVTDVARDDPTGDLYVSTDFGVLRLESGDTSWEVAGDGLPVVETPGLTIATSARRLYAATHGMGIWYLKLPFGRHDSDHDQDRDRDR